MDVKKCDKCGADSRNVTLGTYNLEFSKLVDGIEIEHDIDLCESCSTELFEYLRVIAHSDINNT